MVSHKKSHILPQQLFANQTNWSMLSQQWIGHRLRFSVSLLHCIGAMEDTTFYSGVGEGPVFLDNTQCVGTEGDLLKCTTAAASGRCDHSQDIGLSCPGQPHLSHRDTKPSSSLLCMYSWRHSHNIQYLLVPHAIKYFALKLSQLKILLQNFPYVCIMYPQVQ